MSDFNTAFGLSSTLVASVMFGLMVVEGVKNRRIKVEPNHPPIVLRERPRVFIGVLLLFSTLAILCLGTFLKIASLAL
jgi:hypothetical protein